ncbi:thioredoxin-related transmembrane protein 4 [Denticeps clupeoides]|nr:thioredoxin-related transmembrane protein 4 [Denticeps clupeoides]
MCTGNMAGRGKWKPLLLLLLLLSVSAEGAVQAVADANWTAVLRGEWMLKFYAPWCPACQNLQGDWDTFGKKSESLGISVGKVDVTQQPGLSGRFLVTTLPTIFHAKDGNFRRYLSSRAIEDFQAYILEKKWEAVEPIAGWKSPSSILMSGMAGLFRLSVWIRQIHTYLTDTLNIPVWGSYVIFAITTLFIGLILGLILVLIADCCCPSRPKHTSYKEVPVNEEGSDDEFDAPPDEKGTLDADNESERVSPEESTEEDTPVTEISARATEDMQRDAGIDGTVRKRRTQDLNSLEGT